MKKYKVIDIMSSFGLFLDDVVEAQNEVEAIRNYIKILKNRVDEYYQMLEERELDE